MPNYNPVHYIRGRYWQHSHHVNIDRDPKIIAKRSFCIVNFALISLSIVATLPRSRETAAPDAVTAQ